ncbi:hypothetical protein ACH4FX_03355, partial [Streptomyces sp. NPDC018019]|uniref:hypothetical protein n=1 Tax=Streptomyces sp. NPDC018019 TaxID=3365030 RepID=UPI003789649F
LTRSVRRFRFPFPAPCWSGPAVRLSLSGLSDSIRSDFQSVTGLNSFPISSEGFAFRLFRLYQNRFTELIGARFPDKDSEVLHGINVPAEADERLTVALEHV